MTLLHQAAQKAVEALKYMQSEKVDYMIRNKLGDPSKETATKLANDAIAALESALQQQPEPEWVAQVVSSGPHNFPLLEWRSANHSLETAIGAKLYTAPPALQERRRTEYTPGGLPITVVDDAPALQHQEVPCSNTPYDGGPFTIAPAGDQEVPREPVNINNDFCPVYAVFGIGSAVRTPDVLLANVENAMRRTRCLDAIEREFFTVPTPPDPDEGDDEPGEECLLNWGSDPEEYVEQFRAALKTLAASPSTTRQQEDGNV